MGLALKAGLEDFFDNENMIRRIGDIAKKR